MDEEYKWGEYQDGLKLRICHLLYSIYRSEMMSWWGQQSECSETTTTNSVDHGGSAMEKAGERERDNVRTPWPTWCNILLSVFVASHSPQVCTVQEILIMHGHTQNMVTQTHTHISVQYLHLHMHVVIHTCTHLPHNRVDLHYTQKHTIYYTLSNTYTHTHRYILIYSRNYLE